MLISPSKIIVVNIHEESNDLGEKVSPYDSLEGKSKNHINTL